ncbi:LuxR C-terminal-related transcriptional regulator [Aurantibacter sp.]|uniref:LuxR C-terminal-related transcriptional regulator n=1 Tax=Aurantibacter sp. TaxID=2807103 RepID=UPI0032677F8F
MKSLRVISPLQNYNTYKTVQLLVMKQDYRKNMQLFKSEIKSIVSNYECNKVSYEHLDNFPINSKQCIYVACWLHGGNVFEKGLKNLTGYDLEEFNTEDLIEYIHPDDRELVMNIVQEVIKHAIAVDLSEGPAHLFLTFRLRKKDGTYMKVLRESSSYELNNEGKMISNFSLLTDISFMDSNDCVEWSFEANELDIQSFKNIVYSVYQDYFTNREKEIIALINDGSTNKEIAEKLYISKHTVATHRKKIFRKAGVSHVQDLILFCKKNGIL